MILGFILELSPVFIGLWWVASIFSWCRITVENHDKKNNMKFRINRLKRQVVNSEIIAQNSISWLPLNSLHIGTPRTIWCKKNVSDLKNKINHHLHVTQNLPAHQQERIKNIIAIANESIQYCENEYLGTNKGEQKALAELIQTLEYCHEACLLIREQNQPTLENINTNLETQRTYLKNKYDNSSLDLPSLITIEEKTTLPSIKTLFKKKLLTKNKQEQ